MNLPLRIRIVGSNDATFSDKSIFTGEVMDENSNPINKVKLEFIPISNPRDSVAVCYTNREGIFVRTLIPGGTWDVIVSCQGFEQVRLKNMNFVSGEHHRQKIILVRK